MHKPVALHCTHPLSESDRRKQIETPDFQNSTSALASSNATQNLKFERADWTSFRTVEGLQQKSGVAADKLRRLVLKELADNALDTSAEVGVGALANGGYFVKDKGPGIDGTPEQIASLFSIARPMISTKLLRLPTRGALGNGLRVVAGSVLASEGSLVVTTMNRSVVLRPERDGSTTIVSAKQVKFPIGTRIEISFGPAIPEDNDALYWAKIAITMRTGQSYAGKSSPFWYDVPQFHELLSASGNTPVRELVANLDGCTGGRAGEIVAEARLGRTVCADLDRAQAARLLQVARDNAKPVTPRRLGAIGPERFANYSYAVDSGTVRFGAEPQAEIPFVVEAWVRSAADMRLGVCINRTSIAGDIYASRDKRDIDIFGCGLHNTVATAAKDKDFTIWLNVTTPYMPITSDGKEPNLEPFLFAIANAIAKAVRKANRPSGGSSKRSQKDVVLDNLEEVIAAVSGEEGYRFNSRQLFYALRPIVMEETGEELKIGNFTGIITDYEGENGEIEGMYREPRGSITHPHRNETITLGTLMVEDYKRPEWTFNKLVYIEKEGANEALKEVRWGERHDCAVMSSKGFSTRAAKDLIDKLVEHDEPVEVFCVHDADAYGTMIYQTLQEATKARGARKIKITNIGLEPWEAVEMGLEVETVEEGKRRKAVAEYVLERDNDESEDWEEWLQINRVELNAMTTPQFIEWLDEKMATFGSGKLIPPPNVLEQELADRIKSKVRSAITERILREAKIDDQVADAIAAVTKPDAANLEKKIKALFKREHDREWRDAIEAVANQLARKAMP
jgi:hypothetical protein